MTAQMDWIALATDPNWKALWESEQMKDWRENLVQKLVVGKWDAETLGFIRGQIAALDRLPRTVEMLATKQQKDAQSEFERQNERANEAARGRFQFPRIA